MFEQKYQRLNITPKDLIKEICIEDSKQDKPKIKVIVGAPLTGKSSFIQKFLYEMIENNQVKIVPILINFTLFESNLESMVKQA